MTREELELEGRRYGVPFNSRTKDETIVERIAVAKASESLDARCEVLWANLWTTKGKFFAGDEVTLPMEEAEDHQADGKVLIL